MVYALLYLAYSKDHVSAIRSICVVVRHSLHLKIKVYGFGSDMHRV